MDEPLVIEDKEDAYELPQIVGEVAFKDVVFGYDATKIILNGVNFKINPGKVLLWLVQQVLARARL